MSKKNIHFSALTMALDNSDLRKQATYPPATVAGATEPSRDLRPETCLLSSSMSVLYGSKLETPLQSLFMTCEVFECDPDIY